MQRDHESWFVHWFGEGGTDAPKADVLDSIDDQMRRRFGTPLYASPGLTAALAWKKSPAGRDWKPLPIATQNLIRGTSMQGRFECCPIVDPLPALYCLDLRWAYAAAAEALTSGREWRDESRPAGGWCELPEVGYVGKQGGGPCEACTGFLGYTPARYLIRYDVPFSWSHVGLLPAPSGSGGWVWPDYDDPQLSPWETWADAAEVRLAIQHGWTIESRERLHCTDVREQRPLRGWVRKLLDLRDDLCAASPHAALYRHAIRAMILQAIGIFAARPRTEVRTVGSLEELPTHELAEESYRELEDGTIEFEDYSRNQGLAPLLHPEFASGIWGLTRNWLLRKRQMMKGAHAVDEQIIGALTLPREQIVGFGLDCLYTTHNPNWPDDGREGRYRVKGYLPGPIPAPANRRELELLGKQMTDGGS